MLYDWVWDVRAMRGKATMSPSPRPIEVALEERFEVRASRARKHG